MNLEFKIPAGFEEVTHGLLRSGYFVVNIESMKWEEVETDDIMIGDDVDMFYCVIRPIKES